MKVEQARLFAAALLAAADQAEAEGRDLRESDLTTFAAADDAARATLQASIDKIDN